MPRERKWRANSLVLWVNTHGDRERPTGRALNWNDLPSHTKRIHCLSLRLMYQDVEEGLRHVEGGSPISLLDGISDRKSRFHAEMDLTEVKVEGQKVQNRSPTTRGFGDHEDPAIKAWGRKVGHLFDGLFGEEGRDLLFQGSSTKAEAGVQTQEETRGEPDGNPMETETPTSTPV